MLDRGRGLPEMPKEHAPAIVLGSRRPGPPGASLLIDTSLRPAGTSAADGPRRRWRPRAGRDGARSSWTATSRRRRPSAAAGAVLTFFPGSSTPEAGSRGIGRRHPPMVALRPTAWWRAGSSAGGEVLDGDGRAGARRGAAGTRPGGGGPRRGPSRPAGRSLRLAGASPPAAPGERGSPASPEANPHCGLHPAEAAPSRGDVKPVAPREARLHRGPLLEGALLGRQEPEHHPLPPAGHCGAKWGRSPGAPECRTPSSQPVYRVRRGEDLRRDWTRSRPLASQIPVRPAHFYPSAARCGIRRSDARRTRRTPLSVGVFRRSGRTPCPRRAMSVAPTIREARPVCPDPTPCHWV